MSAGTRRARLHQGHAALSGLTGGGVAVAVIDSGVHAGHPHVGGVAGGVAIGSDLRTHDDYVDRLGHGTAVTAVIREKAPGADVHVVKVFDRELSTSVDALVRAIDWAVDKRVALINLSLGTPRPDHESALSPAVRRAIDNGTTIVSAWRSGVQHFLPGDLPGVVGVELDWTFDRHEIEIVFGADDHVRIVASGYPRPAPGVPPAMNLHGLSFAVANATGLLARIAERTGPERLGHALRTLLAD